MQATLDTASAAFFAGQPQAALEQLQSMPPSHRGAPWGRLHGVVLATLGQLPEAISQFQALLEADPRDIEARINLGASQAQSGALEAALATLAIATAEAPQSGAAWHHQGLAQLRLRHWAAAADSFYQAARCMPQNPLPRALAAQALARVGAQAPAKAALSSIPLEQADSECLLQMAAAWMALNRPAEAESLLSRIQSSDAAAPLAQIQRAALREKANDLQAVQALLEGLPPAWKAEPTAALVRSRLLRRQGQPEQALEALPQSGIPNPDLAVEIQFEKARLLDSLDRYAEAHEAARVANAGARQLRPGSEAVLEGLLSQGLSPEQKGRWTELPPAARTPIFLLGLPRSGSTLLDLLLDGHPQLQLLSETPLLENLLPTLQTLTGLPYPESLGALGPEQALRLREQYFAQAAELLPEAESGLQLVDKNPLNLLRLPLIARLFPEALILHGERALKDTALSCFLNDMGGRGPQGFWSLPESLHILEQLQAFAAEHYALLGLNPHRVSYEELVQAPEATLRSLCKTMGLDFEPSMLDTTRTAQGRGPINTPSYAAVLAPVRTDRIGRAHHYAAYFQLGSEAVDKP